MDVGLYAAASAMSAYAQNQEIIAKNLANVNTIGYRRVKGEFESFGSIFNWSLGLADNPSVTMGSGVTLAEPTTDFSEGHLMYTGNRFDVALRDPSKKGNFFFEIRTNNGPRYTRAGNFTLTGGKIVTQDGHAVVGKGGDIELPKQWEDVKIDKSGKVSVKVGQLGGGETWTDVGSLRIVQFSDLSNLSQITGTTFALIDGRNDGRSAPPGSFEVKQGYLERSNVNVISEMVEMIEKMRSFQISTNVLKKDDETLRRLIATAMR